MPSASPRRSKGTIACISITSCCCGGQPKTHILDEVVQRPTLKRPDANSPTEVALSLETVWIWLFLKTLYVLLGWKKNCDCVFVSSCPTQEKKKDSKPSFSESQWLDSENETGLTAFPKNALLKGPLVNAGACTHQRWRPPKKKSYRGECSVWASSFCKSLWSWPFDVCAFACLKSDHSPGFSAFDTFHTSANWRLQKLVNLSK